MSEQGQSVNISGSVCLYHNDPTPPCSADAAVHGVYTSERGCVSVTLRLQNQVAGWIWCAGHTSLTPGLRL